jgi:hypothetical protein
LTEQAAAAVACLVTLVVEARLWIHIQHSVLVPTNFVNSRSAYWILDFGVAGEDYLLLSGTRWSLPIWPLVVGPLEDVLEIVSQKLLWQLRESIFEPQLVEDDSSDPNSALPRMVQVERDLGEERNHRTERRSALWCYIPSAT